MTLSLKGLHVRLRTNDTYRVNYQHYAEIHCDRCRVLFIVMQCVIKANVVMLRTVAPSARECHLQL
jgi:hypothetical protein